MTGRPALGCHQPKRHTLEVRASVVRVWRSATGDQPHLDPTVVELYVGNAPQWLNPRSETIPVRRAAGCWVFCPAFDDSRRLPRSRAGDTDCSRALHRPSLSE